VLEVVIPVLFFNRPVLNELQKYGITFNEEIKKFEEEV